MRSISKATLVLLLCFGFHTSLTAASPSCIGRITKQFDDLAGRGDTGVTFETLRDIIRSYDYADVQRFSERASMRMAWRRVFTSLSEMIELCDGQMSGKAMEGYIRLCGGIIGDSGKDGTNILKLIFGGEQNFDAARFNAVMEALADGSKWNSQLEWNSIAGLRYADAPGPEAHRILHALLHKIPPLYQKPHHGIWLDKHEDVLKKIDDVWIDNSTPIQDIRKGSRRFVIKEAGTQVGAGDLGSAGGSVNPADMTRIAYILDGNDRIVTVYPVDHNFSFTP